MSSSKEVEKVVSDNMTLRLAKMVIDVVSSNPELAISIANATSNAETALQAKREAAAAAAAKAAADMGKVASSGNVEAIVNQSLLITKLAEAHKEALAMTASDVLADFQTKLQSEAFREVYASHFGKVPAAKAAFIDSVIGMHKYSKHWVYVPQIDKAGELNKKTLLVFSAETKDEGETWQFVNLGEIAQGSLSALHEHAAKLLGLSEEEGSAMRAQGKNGSSENSTPVPGAVIVRDAYCAKHPEASEKLAALATE